MLAEIANIDDIGSELAGKHRQLDGRETIVEGQGNFSRLHFLYTFN